MVLIILRVVVMMEIKYKIKTKVVFAHAAPSPPCRGPQNLRSGCAWRGGAKAGGFWACHTCLAMMMMMVLAVVTMMMLMVMVVIMAQNIN